MNQTDINIRSCAIIGCGNVGAATAYALMHSKLLSKLFLIDINKKKAFGEAEDISHALPFNAPMEIVAGDYKDITDCGIIIITAGINQTPGQTRLDLLQKNAEIFRSIVDHITEFNRDALILVVTNPVDILTYITLSESHFSSCRVIGSGTVLDTARLKEQVGRYLGVDSRNVHSFVIGEHGDSEVAVWSSANVSGIDVCSYCNKFVCNCDEHSLKSIFENVRDAAYSIIEAKGATYYAIAEAVKRIVTAIVRDEHTILPVSALLTGQYGVSDICLGVPCVIGKNGIEEILEIPLNEAEKRDFLRSANSLHTALSNIGMKVTI